MFSISEFAQLTPINNESNNESNIESNNEDLFGEMSDSDDSDTSEIIERLSKFTFK